MILLSLIRWDVVRCTYGGDIMPRLRKTESQRRAERFVELYRVGKARIDMTEDQIGDTVGMSRPALQRRRENPEKYVSLGDLVKFGKIFGWTDDDFLAIIHAEKRKLSP